MTNTLHNNLRLEQIDLEELLAGCVFYEPAVTRTTLSWFEADWLIDIEIKAFWIACRDNTLDSTQAAISVGKDFYIRCIDLIAGVPYMRSIEGYALQIQELHQARTIILPSALGIVNLLAQNQRNFGEVQKLAQEITDHTTTATRAGRIPLELHMALVEEMDGIQNKTISSVKTFIPDIDAVMGAMEAGAIYLIAADTSVGKTAFALQIARNNARHAVVSGVGPVVYFSLEMTGEQVWRRVAAGTAGIDYRTVLGGKASPAEIQIIENVSNKLQVQYGDKLIVVDDVSDVERFRSICAQAQPSLVVVDHLDEINWRGRTEEHVWRGRALTYMKMNIGKPHKCPIIVLHQLNRDVAKRKDKRPQLHDLRQDGTIEQKSDVVIMLYREDYYTPVPGATKVPMEAIFKKYRGGGRNDTVTVEYDLQAQWMNTISLSAGYGLRNRITP